MVNSELSCLNVYSLHSSLFQVPDLSQTFISQMTQILKIISFDKVCINETEWMKRRASKPFKKSFGKCDPEKQGPAPHCSILH